ncbi:enoyl-CoA hydratase/isomerase family protein, partial [Streptomyces sp. S12]|nr:enoyl-CoA hydratase/isomerase family protein [Streptomyces sp. S12]
LASYPPTAVQGTVRALWSAKEATRTAAFSHASHLITLGNLPPDQQAKLFAARSTDDPRIR